MGQELTFGEKAVGMTFNPSGISLVDMVKSRFAYVIDELNTLRSGEVSGETKRLLSIAITEAQTAQMWAVKAITWKE